MDQGLVALLKEEYHSDSLSAECKALILEYMRRTDSVLHEDVWDIKRLTKKAQYIPEAEIDCLDDFLRKLFKFQLQGIQKIQTIAHSYSDDGSILRLEFLLYTNLADVADRIFELAVNNNGRVDVQLQWLENCYLARTKSARKSVKDDPTHSAHAFSVAGAKAKKGFYIAKEYYRRIGVKSSKAKRVKIMWANRWYNAEIASAVIAIKSDPFHSAHGYAFAGDAQKILYELTWNMEHAKESVRCYNVYLAYFEAHPNPEMNGIISTVESKKDLLERLLVNSNA